MASSRKAEDTSSLSSRKKMGWREERVYGEAAAARFNHPTAVVVDKEGTIVVADVGNHRLCRMTGRHVTTLAGSSEAGTADGAGAGARFTKPWQLVLDETDVCS